MRISTRICSVVLAGTLVCGMGVASLALADSAAAPAEPVAVEAAASQASSFKIFSNGLFQMEVPEVALDADCIYEDSDGIELEYEADDMSFGIVAAFMNYSTADMATMLGADATDAAVVADFMASSLLEEVSSGLENVGDPVTHDRYLEGALVHTVALTGDIDGQTVELTVVALCADEGIAVAVTYCDLANDDACYMIDQVNHSLTVVAGAVTGEAPAAEPVAVAEPTAEPAAEPAGTEAPAAVEGGATFELPGWTVTIATDPADMRFETVAADHWDSDVAGKDVIAIPVTVTNTGTETSSAWLDLTFTAFGPSGVAQYDANWSFDDGIYDLPDMRAGATGSSYVYVIDEGDGTYAVEISAWDEEYNLVKEEIVFEVAR